MRTGKDQLRQARNMALRLAEGMTRPMASGSPRLFVTLRTLSRKRVTPVNDFQRGVT